MLKAAQLKKYWLLCLLVTNRLAILDPVGLALQLLEYRAPSLKDLLNQRNNYSILLYVQQDEKQKNEASSKAVSLKI